MFRPALVLVGAAAVGALLLSTVAFGQSSAAKKLKGTVGPGYTISLKQNGKKVKTLKAGTYKFVISDKASIHNFVVEKEKGGKFEKSLTSIGFMGTKTVTVKLTKGRWKFYCKPHESQMFGFFAVT
jgi:plastocyanin